MSQNYGYCRGCGKQILWTKTPQGKAMPCDPEVIWFMPGGDEVFITPNGDTKRGTRSGYEGLIGYVPHWATCPKRDDFKKKGA